MVTMRPGIDEEDLVRLYQRGDERAFDRLMDVCAPHVLGVTYRMLGNHDDAEEAAQEVFIRLHKALKRFKWEAAFSTFLYRIIMNVCSLIIKQKQRRRFIIPFIDLSHGEDECSPLDSLADVTTPEDCALQTFHNEKLQWVIMQIAEPFRSVLVLYEIVGMDYQEISRTLEADIGTVKSRLNRARKKFRDIVVANREHLGY